MAITANNQQNLILFDWFSVTSRIDTAESIIKLLSLEGIHWQKTVGMHGYIERYYYDGISIHFNNPLSDFSVWLEMSGQGCRAFETFGHGKWNFLFELLLSQPEDYHLTRLDVAYDDWEGLLDIDLLEKEIEKHNVRMQFRNAGVDKSFYKLDKTLYYGSKKSDCMFRCYNKAAERNREEVEHWIRFELQLRNNNALGFVSAYMDTKNIGATFAGVVRHYLNYVQPDKNDTNKSRWKTRKWWLKFLDNASEISIWSKKDIEYNLYRLSRYVFNNCGNAIDCAISVFGIEDFLKKLENREVQPNPKYQKILDDVEYLEAASQNSNDILEFLQKLGLD